MKNLMIKSSVSTAAMLSLITFLPASASAQIGFYNTDSYVGAGTGAVLGGVIGSNLAASNAQQEGTAIGAVLGGLAGNALANSSGSYGSGYTSSYGYNAQSSRYGYSSTYYGAPQPLYTGPRSGPYYTGGYVAGPVFTRVIPQAPVRVITPAPRVVYQAPKTVTHTVIVRPEPTVMHYEAPRAETIIEQVPCPSGTTTQADGTCLENNVVASAPIYTAPTYTTPIYTTPSYTAPAPVYSAPEIAPCPVGTSTQADGTCMESRGAYSSSSISSYTSYATPSVQSYEHNSTLVYGGGSYDSLAGSVYEYESSPSCDCSHDHH